MLALQHERQLTCSLAPSLLPGCAPAAAAECGSEQCYVDPEMEEAMVLR